MIPMSYNTKILFLTLSFIVRFELPSVFLTIELKSLSLLTQKKKYGVISLCDLSFLTIELNLSA